MGLDTCPHRLYGRLICDSDEKGNGIQGAEITVTLLDRVDETGNDGTVMIYLNGAYYYDCVAV